MQTQNGAKKRRTIQPGLTLLSMLALSACAWSAASEVETEQLTAEVPQGWVKVIDRKAGTLHLAEYYPQGSGEDWQQKLTVEALSGTDLPDPIVFAHGLAAEQRKVCDHFSDDSVFAGFENGYPTVVHMMQCGVSKRTGKALVTMLKAIRGNKAFYTITRIWRLPPTGEPGEIPLDDAELGAWSQSLREVKVCDASLQAHACTASG